MMRMACTSDTMTSTCSGRLTSSILALIICTMSLSPLRSTTSWACSAMLLASTAYTAPTTSECEPTLHDTRTRTHAHTHTREEAERVQTFASAGAGTPAREDAGAAPDVEYDLVLEVLRVAHDGPVVAGHARLVAQHVHMDPELAVLLKVPGVAQCYQNRVAIPIRVACKISDYE
jgi:hypothetical protein